MSERKLVYVAGAYRGDTAWEVRKNVHEAMTAAVQMAELIDIVPVIPHTMYHGMDGAFPEAWFVEATKELMLRCDAVWVFHTGDLDTSDGTKGEVEAAAASGIPVFVGYAGAHNLVDWAGRKEGNA